ncbi:MAG: hypothetical protein HGA44_05930 [Cellulomonadaceae bacterium]|nr:hypothetical protein [Cellulomonadaceae bacterium]
MTPAVYVVLIALLVLTGARDIRRRPRGQGAFETIKRPSPVSWAVMALAAFTIVLLER